MRYSLFVILLAACLCPLSGRRLTAQEQPQVEPPAQPPPAVEEAEPMPAPAGLNRIQHNNIIAEAKLRNPIEGKFDNVPLIEALAAIAEAADVSLHVNRKELAEAGMPIDQPVSLDVAEASASTILELLLEQVGDVGFSIRDGVLVIPGEEGVVGPVTIQAYPVADLVGMRMSRLDIPVADTLPGPVIVNATVPAEATHLMDVITTAIAPSTWDRNGGDGTVAYYRGLLLVRHTARTHHEIEALLTTIRKVADASQE